MQHTLKSYDQTQIQLEFLDNQSDTDHHHQFPLLIYTHETIPSLFNPPYTHHNRDRIGFLGPSSLPQPATEGDLGIQMDEIGEINNVSDGAEVNNRECKNSGIGGRKRKRKNEGEGEKPRDVIHVRAKRGQAADSHSLAERVRRERINEKLRVLQNLVPGCYKTMGMAVMLDVIINYLRSLQNQIEFLSMKLSAASLFFDFNSPEAEALEAFQRTNHNGGREMERENQEYGAGQLFHSSTSTWPF